MDIDQEITNAMPTVANVGEAPHHHHRDHHGGAGPGPSAAAVLAAQEARAAAEEDERRDAAGMALLPKLEPPRVRVTPRQQFVLIRWAQKFAGALVGLGTAAFLLIYQWVVEPAPHGSLRARAFVALTQVRRRRRRRWGLGGRGGDGRQEPPRSRASAALPSPRAVAPAHTPC
jgi:hypothetical protein